jgi:hypothetical protein
VDGLAGEAETFRAVWADSRKLLAKTKAIGMKKLTARLMETSLQDGTGSSY